MNSVSGPLVGEGDHCGCAGGGGGGHGAPGAGVGVGVCVQETEGVQTPRPACSGIP